MKKTLLKAINCMALFLITISANAQTPGTLTFTYNQPQPTSPAPNAGIKNVLAVWIENGTGTFIKTKYRFVSTSTKDHLPTWAVKSGGALTNATTATCNTTDAISGATCTATATTTGTIPAGSIRPTAFGSKTITWDGKNVVGTINGTTVADGTYKVWVESSWVDSGSNNHNELVGFTFTKGPTSVHLTPTGDTYINGVVIDWVPSALSVAEVQFQEPSVVIYPVPSSGIFNLSLKNDLKNIKVFNLLGQIVYSENSITPTSQTIKTLDLTGLSNGNYVISLENDYGIANYEVIIDK